MFEYPIWSLSKWRDFEQCPAMYYAKNVSKKWKDFPNDAMERGRKMHKLLEDSIKYDLELPAELQHMEPAIKSIVGMRAAGAAVYPEMKFGVSKQYGKVEFFDGERLRVRLVLDVFVKDDNKLLIIDWKTGKAKTEHKEDAEFYGALAHICFGPTSTSVMYSYIDAPEATFMVDCGAQATEVAATWWKKFDYADRIIAGGNPPVEPCNACSWCGAYECPKNRNKKLGVVKP